MTQKLVAIERCSECKHHKYYSDPDLPQRHSVLRENGVLICKKEGLVITEFPLTGPLETFPHWCPLKELRVDK